MHERSDSLAEMRLFERLVMSEQESPAQAARCATKIESIKRHLVDLLNSHPGHSESAPQLGLPDFNDATIGILDLELNVRRAIRSCIERFEPRSSRVRMESVPNGSDPLQLRFQIHATLAVEHGQAQTTIDLLLNDKRYQCLTHDMPESGPSC